MTEWYSTLWIYHILLVYSSVDRHLGCFHVLATIIMLLRPLLHKYLTPCFQFFEYTSQSRIAQLLNNIILFQLFEKLLQWFFHFSTWLYCFTFPPETHMDSNFSSPYQHFFFSWFFFFFNNSHSNGCTVVSHCSFDLHLPNDEWLMMSILWYAYWEFVYLLWRNVYSITLSCILLLLSCRKSVLSIFHILILY